MPGTRAGAKWAEITKTLRGFDAVQRTLQGYFSNDEFVAAIEYVVLFPLTHPVPLPWKSTPRFLEVLMRI